MADVLTVDLRGRIAGGEAIDFLRAEMNGAMATPFALIRYAVNGVEPRDGLRIDLDKRVILDRLGDPKTDEVIERAAPEIADILAPVVSKRDLKIWSSDPQADQDAATQAVLWLSFQGHTLQEISEQSGLPEAAVSKIQRTAQKRLTNLLFRSSRGNLTENETREEQRPDSDAVLTREEVVIERTPVLGRAVAEGEEVHIPVREEHVNVIKHAAVGEEVKVGKRAVQDTKRVSGQVGKDKVFVEKKGDVDVR